MMRKRYYCSIFVLLLTVFLCHPAIAAKCVKPNGAGGCYDVIQDAIDAVADGGTVKVYPGIYYENFSAGKPGITIEGMGSKRTDVRIDLAGSGFNIIGAANVTIKNLTIQNCDNGVVINNAGSNAKIFNVNIFDSASGIAIVGSDDILINKCKFLKSTANGVDNPSGARLRVKNTTISDCGGHGISCGGEQLMVDGCTIENSVGDLIRVEGSQAVIQDNQLFEADGSGIRVISDFSNLTGNLVRGTGASGISIVGEAPTIRNNTVMHAQGSGFYFEVTGGDIKVVNNQSSYNHGNGFFSDSSSSVLFKKNKALKNEGGGFYIDGPGEKTIIENQAKNNKGTGISVSDGTVENNIASENGLYGYNFGSNNIATKNKALNNMEKGFNVAGDNNSLRNNRAIGNLTYGIHVTGTGQFNDIINNTMLDSLYDRCNEGTNNTWSGNDFDTDCNP